MATLAPILPPPPPFPVARFTVGQYHRMIETGILGDDDAVELLHGWITPKMPRNPPHDSTIARCQRLLMVRLGESFVVRGQSAVTLSDSQPEPDVAVAIGPDSRYDDRHPGPGELLLVVEVSDSSLDRDRDVKAAIYAEASIPAYWIVNLVDRQVEVHADPTGPGAEPAYRSFEIYMLDDAVPLVGFGASPLAVPVRELLPTPPKTT